RLPSQTSEDDLCALIETLNKDERVHGVLVQLPLPKHINEKRIISLIDYRKDVDGFHPVNVGKLVVGDDDCFYPCTPYGCKILINKVIPDPKGMHCVIVGRSNIVGKPMANLMVQKKPGADCIVTVCHSAAKNLKEYTLSADILIAAIGSPEFITADMVKEGAVVIDVGMNRIQNPADPAKTKLVGDVKFDEVSQKAYAITPVPGGVGKMTIAMLLANTVKSFRNHNSI
ncbi:MAG: bifunctional 5,10-methylenetetrahydrofolate dehydrogenase/5,10-methenyltetrahydrofolate cyclohydrolase, partial [Spirochaetota bacterium]